jgi:hypothetical protein
MNIEELKALGNAAINGLCAVKVMGWRSSDCYESMCSLPPRHNWNPTEDMNDALILIGKVTQGADFDLTYNAYYQCNGDNEGWSCRFPSGPNNPKSHSNVWANKATLAICYAALLAQKETPEEEGK